MDNGIAVINTVQLRYVPATARKVTISAEDVPTLLGPHPAWAARSKDWNPQILDRLAAIDNGAGEVFSDRDSAFARLKVRMIDPQPSRPIDDIDSGINRPLTYDTLSYTWHKDSWVLTRELRLSTEADSEEARREAPESHVLNPISTDFWKVLLSESAAAGNMLWVDQVCINQEDREETTISVGFTDRIYQNSDRVFIVIEDLSIPESSIPSLRALIDMEDINQQSYTSLSPTTVQHAFSFCTTLFSARLFSRSWCWHEFACSDRHIIFVPIAPEEKTNTTDLKILRMDSLSLRNVLYSVSMMIRNASDEQMVSITPFQDAILKALQTGAKLLKRQTNPTFVDAYRNTFRSMAKHRADQLTITLNSCNSRLLYTGPPLDSEEDCYRLINSVAFAAGDASVIGVTGQKLSNRSKSLSTWLMKPSNDEARPGLSAMVLEPTPFNVLINEQGALVIDVVQLGLAKDVRQPDSRFLNIASAFMDLDFERICQREPFVREIELHNSVWDPWQRGELSLRYVNHKFFFAQALAYLLDRRDDNAAILDVLDDPALPGPRLFRGSDRDRLSAVLGWLRGFSGHAHSHALASTRPLAIVDADLAVVAHFLLTFVGRILGVKDMYDTENPQSWSSYMIGTLSSGILSKADIPIVVPRTSRDAIIVVPADVAGPQYSLLRRVWVLQKLGTSVPAFGPSNASPSAADHKFSLLSKTMLVGFQDLGSAARDRVEII